LVEVTDGSSKVSFTVPDIPTVGVGNKTRPLCITTVNAPHTEATIDIALANADITGVTFSPNSLKFSPDVNERCFTVAIASDYAIDTSGSQQSATFTITGTDKNAYNTIAAKTLIISSVAVTEAGNVTTCRASDPARTSATVSASTDSAGIVYVAVAAKGASIPSQSDIATQVGDIFNEESNPTITTEEKSDDVCEATDEDDANEVAWVNSQRAVLKACLNARYYNAVSVPATTSTAVIMLNGLCASTDYQSSCYVVNASQTSSAVLTETWTTDAIAPPVYFRIQLAGDIADTQATGIRNAAARRLGLCEYRLFGKSRTTTRRLQTGNTITNTDFQWTLGQSTAVESPTPTELANINSDSENQAALTEELRTLITGYGPTAAITYTNPAIPAATTPQWVTGATPALSGTPTTSSITASMQCNVSGSLCGVCEPTSSVTNAITHDQILTGVDSNNVTTTAHNCQDYTSTDNSATLTVSNLSAGTQYKCSYQCFNTYPVFPGYVSYTEDNPINSISTTTAASEEQEDDDFSSYQLQSIIGLLLVLVF
jgi:hypothetical protein